jgi:hypothetical protein
MQNSHLKTQKSKHINALFNNIWQILLDGEMLPDTCFVYAQNLD